MARAKTSRKRVSSVRKTVRKASRKTSGRRRVRRVRTVSYVVAGEKESAYACALSGATQPKQLTPKNMTELAYGLSAQPQAAFKAREASQSLAAFGL